GDQDVIRADCGELERKGVDGSLELARGQDDRRCKTAVVPGRGAGSARAQVLFSQRLDDRHCPHRLVRGVVTVIVRRLTVALQPVGQQRHEARSEHSAQLALEYRESRKHSVILANNQLRIFAPMNMRTLTIGCFGGGTGLPSLLGGLKNNPWLDVNAIVTMFDSGGSSGQLRDELGVLPPG